MTFPKILQPEHCDGVGGLVKSLVAEEQCHSVEAVPCGRNGDLHRDSTDKTMELVQMVAVVAALVELAVKLGLFVPSAVLVLWEESLPLGQAA